MLSQEDPSDAERAFVVVEESWQENPDARGYVNALLKRNKRRTFGLLEKPHLDPQHKHPPVLSKKLFLVGKSGVGKTSTIDKLSGRDISLTHNETLGIQTTTLYWPAKLVEPRKVILVHLEMWDVGDKALSKFEHIRPACRQATDGTVFFFSFADRNSWEDLPHLVSSYSQDSIGNDLNIVVGTHADCSSRDVTEEEVKHFEQRHKLVVLPIANVNGARMTSDPSTPDGREGIKEITPFMNTLTQVLLAHTHRQSMINTSATAISGDHDNMTTPATDFIATLSPDTESPSQ